MLKLVILFLLAVSAFAQGPTYTPVTVTINIDTTSLQTLTTAIASTGQTAARLGFPAGGPFPDVPTLLNAVLTQWLQQYAPSASVQQAQAAVVAAQAALGAAQATVVQAPAQSLQVVKP